MAYADSSLLLKLYLLEPETPAALAALSSFAGSVIFTPLHRLEIVNAIRRKQALKALQTLRADLRSGFYLQPPLDWAKVFQRSHRLSRKHASKLLVRSLDLLHVALALELGTSECLTFDDRQRQAASAQGLTVIP